MKRKNVGKEIIDVSFPTHDVMKEPYKKYSSGVQAYDELTDGIPTGILTVDAGNTMSGKTILNIQKCFSILKEAHENYAIYIDTEGTAKISLYNWKERFEKRFGIKVGIIEPKLINDEESGFEWIVVKPNIEKNIVLITVRDLFRLYEMHGTPISLKISDKGKIDVIRKPLTKKHNEELYIEDTPLGRLLSKKLEPCVMVYDSIIELIKQRIPAYRENFPVRSSLLHMLLGFMQRFAEYFDIPVIGITHTSIDPVTNQETVAALNTISYNCKLITLIKAPYTMEEKRHIRKIMLYRHPYKPPLEKVMYMKLTSEGFVDVPEEELKKFGLG